MEKSLHTDSHKILLEQLVQMRLAVGMRQQDLAIRLDVPQSFVSKYETGERRLDLIELRTICQAMGVSMQSFIDSFEKRLHEAQP